MDVDVLDVVDVVDVVEDSSDSHDHLVVHKAVLQEELEVLEVDSEVVLVDKHSSEALSPAVQAALAAHAAPVAEVALVAEAHAVCAEDVVHSVGEAVGRCPDEQVDMTQAACQRTWLVIFTTSMPSTNP